MDGMSCSPLCRCACVCVCAPAVCCLLSGLQVDLAAPQACVHVFARARCMYVCVYLSFAVRSNCACCCHMLCIMPLLYAHVGSIGRGRDVGVHVPVRCAWHAVFPSMSVRVSVCVCALCVLLVVWSARRPRCPVPPPARSPCAGATHK
jgi:hypothetical protein